MIYRIEFASVRVVTNKARAAVPAPRATIRSEPCTPAPTVTSMRAKNVDANVGDWTCAILEQAKDLADLEMLLVDCQ